MSDEDIYTTTTMSDPATEAAVGAAVAGFIVFYIILLVLIYAVSAFLVSRIFKKAGTNPVVAWIPIYNMWKMLQLGGQQGFWAILTLVPIVNIAAIVFMYIAIYNIGLKLQKEGWFLIIGIVLPLVWYIWLAFDSSVWDESKGAPRLDTPDFATAGAAPVQAAPMTQQPQQPYTPPQGPSGPTPPTTPSI